MQPPGNATQNACPPKLHHATRQNTPTPFPPLLNPSITRINNYPKCTITAAVLLLSAVFITCERPQSIRVLQSAMASNEDDDTSVDFSQLFAQVRYSGCLHFVLFHIFPFDIVYSTNRLAPSGYCSRSVTKPYRSRNTAL